MLQYGHFGKQAEQEKVYSIPNDRINILLLPTYRNFQKFSDAFFGAKMARINKALPCLF